MGVGVSPTLRPPLPPGKTRYPLYRRLGGPQGRSGRAENLVPTGIRSRTVQPVLSRYTDWATWPKHISYISQILHTLSSPWRSWYISQMSHRFYKVRMSTNSATWHSNRPHLSPFKPSHTLQLTTIFPFHEILHNFVLATAALKNLITTNQEVMYEY